MNFSLWNLQYIIFVSFKSVRIQDWFDGNGSRWFDAFVRFNGYSSLINQSWACTFCFGFAKARWQKYTLSVMSSTHTAFVKNIVMKNIFHFIKWVISQSLKFSPPTVFYILLSLDKKLRYFKLSSSLSKTGNWSAGLGEQCSCTTVCRFSGVAFLFW